MVWAAGRWHDHDSRAQAVRAACGRALGHPSTDAATVRRRTARTALQAAAAALLARTTRRHAGAEACWAGRRLGAACTLPPGWRLAHGRSACPGQPRPRVKFQTLRRPAAPCARSACSGDAGPAPGWARESGVVTVRRIAPSLRRPRRRQGDEGSLLAGSVDLPRTPAAPSSACSTPRRAPPSPCHHIGRRRRCCCTPAWPPTGHQPPASPAVPPSQVIPSTPRPSATRRASRYFPPFLAAPRHCSSRVCPLQPACPSCIASIRPSRRLRRGGWPAR